MVKYKVSEVLAILTSQCVSVALCKINIPYNYKTHYGIVKLKSDSEPNSIINYLCDNEIEKENIILVTDMSLFIRDFMEIRSDDVISINTNLDGNIITTDNYTFLSYKNTVNMSFSEGVFKYNAGSHSSPEIEEYEIPMKDKPLFTIVGEQSTFKVYKLNPLWRVTYSRY